MSRKLLFAGVAAGLGVAAVMSSSIPERLQIYGKIREGATLPFSHDVDGRAGEFYVHYFDRYQSESPCQDADCPGIEKILAHGGRFETYDSKAAQAFGIPIIHDGVTFQLADSLMIVTDGNSKVLAIYRGVEHSDVDLAFAAVRNERRTVEKLRRAWEKVTMDGRRLASQAWP